jgi:hypothetical protein
LALVTLAPGKVMNIGSGYLGPWRSYEYWLWLPWPLAKL